MNRSQRRDHWSTRNRTQTQRTASAVEVHIERLVLHGFPPAFRGPVGDVVQSELKRLLTQSGLPRELSTAAEIGQIDKGAFLVNSPATPISIGAQIAGSIFGDPIA